MSPAKDPSDAEFFVDLAAMNLDLGDVRAALVGLETGVKRAMTPRVRARLLALVERLLRTEAKPEMIARVHALAAAARAAPEAAPPVPAETAPVRPSAQSLEAVRRLLISPELVEQLRALVGARPEVQPEAPLSLPAIDVVRRLLAVGQETALTAQVAIDLVVEATRADRGFLVAGSVVFGDGAGPGEASRGVLDLVVKERRTLLVEDAFSDPRFAARESVAELGARSVLCVPVAEGDALLGALYLDAASARRFGQRERELAEALATTVAPALSRARRVEEQGVELARARRDLEGARRESSPRLLGRSRATRELDALLDRVAAAEQTVLVEGESGTGKELAARAIHARSKQSQGPFVAENLAALSPQLVEAELFGHARGAFTGADEARPGLFRLADGGTLFLDEVGEIDESLQRKLLRVLQEREVRPVGGASPVRVSVRVVAATNKDLHELVRTGAFREDLYYRLSVLRVRVPPLRERREDVPLLLAHFVAEAAAAQRIEPPELPAARLEKLARYPWPGNVRELQAYAARLVLEGPGAELASPVPAAPTGALAIELAEGETLPLRAAREVFDRLYVAQVLARSGGNVTAAAKALGLTRSYLSSLAKRLGLRES